MKNFLSGKICLTTYEIKSENIYEEFFKWKDLLDYL